MLWDTHMHSQYSGDSDAPQEDMIRAAIRAKLPGICFTDHLDIDYPDNPEAFLLDLPNYTSSVFAMQEQYRDQISVRYGIELGLQPHLAALHADILSQYDFDFVIGSSHVAAMIRIFRHSGRRTPRRKDTANTLSPSWKTSGHLMTLTSTVTSTMSCATVRRATRIIPTPDTAT